MSALNRPFRDVGQADAVANLQTVMMIGDADHPNATKRRDMFRSKRPARRAGSWF